MKEMDTLKQKKRIYIQLPSNVLLTNHEITLQSGLFKRINPKVKERIHDLVNSGITNVPLVRKKTVRICGGRIFRKKTIRSSI